LNRSGAGPTAPPLWSRRTASIVAVLGAGGFVAMAIAWRGTATTVRVDHQVDWLPLGVAGASAATLAMVGWVLAGRRSVAERVAGLTALVPAHSSSASNAAAESRAGRAAEPAALVATDGMVRYHRPSCPLVAGKPARAQGRAAHEAAGRRPCGICEV
jgi:hypothetical protein